MARNIRQLSPRAALHDLLERIDTRLVDADPNFEQAKIDKVILLLFGPKPDRFVVPEEYRHLSDPPYEWPVPGSKNKTQTTDSTKS